MAQSVKLTNGDYIDAEGVYDATIGMTQQAINNSDGLHTFNLSSVASTSATGTISWIRFGRIVFVQLANAAITQQTFISLTSMGAPTPLMDMYTLIVQGNVSKGLWGARARGDDIVIALSEAATGAYGCLAYVAAE